MESLKELTEFHGIWKFSYYLLLALPIVMICSSKPVFASEFTVQRMSQFDVNGVALGCRSSALSLEAKSLYTWSTGRHCVVAKLLDLTVSMFHEIRQKAGGLVLLLPNDIPNMTEEEKEHLIQLESTMLAQPNSIPIYFSKYNKNLENIIADITRTTGNSKEKLENASQAQHESALSALFASISANGYQIIVSGASHAVNKNSKIPIIQGQLESSMDVNLKLPLLIVTAHLRSFGLYNEYPLNGDAVVLMSLADVFSKLYNTPNATPKYRLLFLLSESGALLNFQGVKKWLDENVQLQNVEFVLCLDTIIESLNGRSNSIYMHVSKPPKEGSSMSNFYKLLKSVSLQYDNITVDGVHKKINLADQQLAWEHERFSMKRLPAFTLSALKTSKEPVRTTIFRDSEAKNLEGIQRNVKIIAEAIARYVYNIDDKEADVFSGAMQINNNLIKSYMNLKSILHNNDLKNAFEKYLKNVKIIYEKPDTRDPDFMFYDGQEANLNVYRVKPAVFDLFLTILICAYLLFVYFIIQYFPTLYEIVCKMSKSQAISPTLSNHTDRGKSKLN